MLPARAQNKEQVFNPPMSLEQTLVWLNKQLTHVKTVTSNDGKTVRRLETRLVKAKECTLSYSSASESDAGIDPTSASSELRELWTLNLSGLDPTGINVVASTHGTEGRVLFKAADTSRNTIRTSTFKNDRLLTTRNNRSFGYFSVRDEKMLTEVAEGLRHAVELCRQRKQ